MNGIADLGAGHAGTLADGLRMEATVSRMHVRGVSLDAIAARRVAIQQRGRAQSN